MPCSDAKGAYGFPNLTDNDWLYGGEPETIKTTIMEGRKAAMPAWKDVIGEEGIKNTAAYVRSLSNLKAPEGVEVDLAEGRRSSRPTVWSAMAPRARESMPWVLPT